MDLPLELYRIWTDERVSESLSEIKSWSYGEIMKANEWLDIMDEVAERQHREQQRQTEKRK